jgi:hypothetical protein
VDRGAGLAALAPLTMAGGNLEVQPNSGGPGVTLTVDTGATLTGYGRVGHALPVDTFINKGTITPDVGRTLEISANTIDLTTGGSSIQYPNATLLLNGTVTPLGGMISNSQTNGTLVLGRSQTYTGGTIIMGTNSTVRVRDDSNLGAPAGSPVMFAGGMAPMVAAPAAGLLAGRIAAATDYTTVNPANRGLIGVGLDEMKNYYASSGVSAIIDWPAVGGRLWDGDNRTWVFTGLLNITTAGTYSFASVYDDGTKLWIDGKNPITTAGNNLGQATMFLAEGAHAFEMRYSQGTGAVGPYNNGTATFLTRLIGLGFVAGTSTNYANYNQISPDMFTGYNTVAESRPTTNWNSVVYENGHAGSAGWLSELNAWWRDALDGGANTSVLANGAAFGAAVDEVATGFAPLLNKVDDDFYVPTGLSVGLRADRGPATGAVPGVVEFTNVGLADAATLYLISKDNANILVNVAKGGATGTVSSVDNKGLAKQYLGDVSLVGAGTGPLTVSGMDSIRFVGKLNGIDLQSTIANLDNTLNSDLYLTSLATAAGIRTANLNGQTIFMNGIGKAVVET